MRILELEISDIRGIRALHLKPSGANLVIWGPNGSGKSAVIDALDFLFTGRMRRLVGEGTAGITIRKHGPHIEAGSTNSFVRALVEFRSGQPSIELIRRLPNSRLEVSAPLDQEAQIALEIAGRGQNILTRREILKFITADAGTRGEQIQALLDLGEVENIRKALSQAENQSKQGWSEASAALEQARSRLAVAVGKDDPGTAEVLSFINENRAVMGADPIPDPHLSELKKDLVAPSEYPGLGGPNIEVLNNHVKLLREHASVDGKQHLTELIHDVESKLAAIDPGTMRELKSKDLVRTGLALLDPSGLCPLCQIQWDPTELKEHLEQRSREHDDLMSQLEDLGGAIQRLRQHLSNTFEGLQGLIPLLAFLGQEEAQQVLGEWSNALDEELVALRQGVEKVAPSFGGDNMATAYEDSRILPILESCESALDTRLEEVNRRVAAWDSLTLLEETIRSSTQAGRSLDNAADVYKRAQLLSATYREARDYVLQELYDSIKDRFVELYVALHSPDESEFTANIQPKGAGIDFQVDFYGHGVHPPHAMHSEGHQDSMGVCLFLALLERLSDSRMNLVLLDDVVMSVDVDHRRRLGKVLRGMFPPAQFVITTHDRTWANQLRTEKVVTSANTVQFYGWNLETGPRVLYEGDLWDRIEKSLETEDVASAAHRLRKGAEEYFQSSCDALRAKVRFSLAGRLELGDFVPAAMSRIRALLKKAQKAADSWKSDSLQGLEEIESVSKQIFQRTNVEQWAINEAVHFNAWENFSSQEFRPVVEAFHDLFDLFRCDKCGTLFRVEMTGATESSVRCDCGATTWNLKVKE